MTLIHSAQGTLYQLKDIISQLSEKDYQQPVGELGGSTLGQHIRHSLEFFLCLFDARNEGRLNYDSRKHDIFIETDPKLALSITDSIIEFLERNTSDFPLIHDANYAFSDAPTISMASSYYRELSYNIEHTIHHMALIKVGLKAQFPEVQLPEHFGVASSTVRYRQSENK